MSTYRKGTVDRMAVDGTQLTHAVYDLVEAMVTLGVAVVLGGAVVDGESTDEIEVDVRDAMTVLAGSIDKLLASRQGNDSQQQASTE